MKEFKLNNGVKIPSIGFGTWQIENGENAYKAVTAALKAGYTHIDTAAVYGNEESVGKAIKDSGISRDKLFVTTKLWNDSRGHERGIKAFKESLKKLELEYVDLYLLHWPANKKQHPNDWHKINESSWLALEEIYSKHQARAIGVSNFLVEHLEPLLDNAKVIPAVNQIEYHPGFVQQDVVDYCKNRDILVEAWSPLGSGRILKDEYVIKLAEKYNVSTGQICMQFCLQQDILPLPKSENPENIKKNIILDFNLTSNEITQLTNLSVTGWSELDPNNIDF